jgi:hypothetical protein
MTCCAIPAWRKEHGHKGVMVENKQQKEWTKDYAVQEAHK